MNIDLLKKYGVDFKIITFDGDKEASVIASNSENISIFLADFFVQISPQIFIEDVLPEIDKAIQGSDFNDSNQIGGAAGIYLEIDSEFSYLVSENASDPKELILTTDLKEVILSWVEWITKNNLEDNIR